MKLKSYKTVLALAAGIATLAPVTALAATGNVSLTYKSYDQLTSSQVATIKTGNPNETIIQSQVDYILVYDKKDGSVTPLADTKGGKSDKVLPSTGELSSIGAFITGLGLLGLSGYILFRHKKTGKLLVVVLAAGGASLAGLTAQAASRALGDIVTASSTIGATFTYDPEDTVGEYYYVGYIVEQAASPTTPPSSTTPSSETGSVVVHYVDQDGNPLQTDYTDSNQVAVGTAYNTAENPTEKPSEITVNGVKYVYASTTGSETGTVTKGTTDVTYHYKAVGSVVIRYRDNFGNKIADDVQLLTDQEVGTSYDTTAAPTFYPITSYSTPLTAAEKEAIRQENYNFMVMGYNSVLASNLSPAQKAQELAEWQQKIDYWNSPNSVHDLDSYIKINNSSLGFSNSNGSVIVPVLTAVPGIIVDSNNLQKLLLAHEDTGGEYLGLSTTYSNKFTGTVSAGTTYIDVVIDHTYKYTPVL